MISTYLLGKTHGHDSPELLQQIKSAMSYTLTQQVRADGLFRARRGKEALGAMPGSPIDRGVRIDYVQHVGSAMIRSAALIE